MSGAHTVIVEGIGVLGPGLADWPSACSVLRGEAALPATRSVLPQPQVLPPTERRRAGRVVRLALAVGAEAVAQADAEARTLPTVFTSSGGDGNNCHEICQTLASSERTISPTRFHNSVHNAPAGYWGIAYGCTAPSTSLCGYDASFAAGLLEAVAQLANGAAQVLLIAYDADYPPPLHANRPIPDACGVALLLSRGDSVANTHAPRLELELTADAHAERVTTLADPQLETLRNTIPAARSLPLLQLLARHGSGRIVLDYLGASLAIASAG